MLPKLPHSLEREREALLKHIADAFSHVSREGGVSWSELAVQPEWDPDDPSDGLNFREGDSFLYYLAAAMYQTATRGQSGYDLILSLTLDNECRGQQLEQWSALNHRHLLCVARFVRYMMLCSEHDPLRTGLLWRRAYESYWSDVEHKTS